MYCITDPVTEPSQVRDILGEEFKDQSNKIIDHIDRHVRAWIERTPFLVLATCDAKGNMDASPKGDPAGFVKVLDEKTLAIPDRIGNHRGDGLFNVLENPRIGLMFVVPERKEVVRVNGRAELARDAALLDMMVVNKHRPDIAIVVRVEEAFFHCGKAMIRGGMWWPERWPGIEGLPSYAEAVKDHAESTKEVAEIERAFAFNEERRLYEVD